MKNEYISENISKFVEHSQGSAKKKLISTTFYVKKLERYKVNELTICLNEIENQQQNNPKINKKKRISKNNEENKQNREKRNTA